MIHRQLRPRNCNKCMESIYCKFSQVICILSGAAEAKGTREPPGASHSLQAGPLIAYICFLTIPKINTCGFLCGSMHVDCLFDALICIGARFIKRSARVTSVGRADAVHCMIKRGVTRTLRNNVNIGSRKTVFMDGCIKIMQGLNLLLMCRCSKMLRNGTHGGWMSLPIISLIRYQSCRPFSPRFVELIALRLQCEHIGDSTLLCGLHVVQERFDAVNLHSHQ